MANKITFIPVDTSNGKSFSSYSSARDSITELINSSYDGHEFQVIIETSHGRCVPIFKLNPSTQDFASDLLNEGFLVVR